MHPYHTITSDGRRIAYMDKDELTALLRRCGDYEAKVCAAHATPRADVVTVCEAAHYYADRMTWDAARLRHYLEDNTDHAQRLPYPALWVLCDAVDAGMDTNALEKVLENTYPKY